MVPCKLYYYNNNNIQDNVYGAVIMADARVHPVHLMNEERRQAAADLRPTYQARRLRL